MTLKEYRYICYHNKIILINQMVFAMLFYPAFCYINIKYPVLNKGLGYYSSRNSIEGFLIEPITN